MVKETIQGHSRVSPNEVHISSSESSRPRKARKASISKTVSHDSYSSSPKISADLGEPSKRCDSKVQAAFTDLDKNPSAKSPTSRPSKQPRSTGQSSKEPSTSQKSSHTNSLKAAPTSASIISQKSSRTDQLALEAIDLTTSWSPSSLRSLWETFKIPEAPFPPNALTRPHQQVVVPLENDGRLLSWNKDAGNIDRLYQHKKIHQKEPFFEHFRAALANLKITYNKHHYEILAHKLLISQPDKIIWGGLQTREVKDDKGNSSAVINIVRFDSLNNLFAVYDVSAKRVSTFFQVKHAFSSSPELFSSTLARRFNQPAVSTDDRLQISTAERT